MCLSLIASLQLFFQVSVVDSLFYTSINEDDSFQCKRFVREAKKHKIKKRVINSYLKSAKMVYSCEEK